MRSADLSPDQLFRALADATRLRSIALLHRHGSLCVCELTDALELSQPKVSRHLAHLRALGLVIDARRGQWVHYRLAEDLPEWIHTVIDAATAACHAPDSPWQLDLQRSAPREGKSTDTP